MRDILLIATISVGLAGCMIPGRDISDEISSRVSANPTPSDFIVCHSHGCSNTVAVSLTESEWQTVTDYLETPPETAGQERKQLMLALAQAEKVVGEKTGTSEDVGGSFAGIGRKFQLDCVDEMINTATYLTMLNDNGLLRFHSPDRRVTQSFFARSFWTHTVATVKENDSQQEYIIDTWVLDNGELPYIMPIEDWDAGEEMARVY